MSNSLPIAFFHHFAKPAFDMGGAIFVSAWGAMFLGFALWMIFWPNKYWAMWKKYLRDAEFAQPNDLYFAQRDAIKLHVTTTNPKRKARIWGTIIIIIVCIIELVIWRVILYGPFGT